MILAKRLILLLLKEVEERCIFTQNWLEHLLLMASYLVTTSITIVNIISITTTSSNSILISSISTNQVKFSCTFKKKT